MIFAIVPGWVPFVSELKDLRGGFVISSSRAAVLAEGSCRVGRES